MSQVHTWIKYLAFHSVISAHHAVSSSSFVFWGCWLCLVDVIFPESLSDIALRHGLELRPKLNDTGWDRDPLVYSRSWAPPAPYCKFRHYLIRVWFVSGKPVSHTHTIKQQCSTIHSLTNQLCRNCSPRYHPILVLTLTCCVARPIHVENQCCHEVHEGSTRNVVHDHECWIQLVSRVNL